MTELDNKLFRFYWAGNSSETNKLAHSPNSFTSGNEGQVGTDFVPLVLKSCFSIPSSLWCHWRMACSTMLTCCTKPNLWMEFLPWHGLLTCRMETAGCVAEKAIKAKTKEKQQRDAWKQNHSLPGRHFFYPVIKYTTFLVFPLYWSYCTAKAAPQHTSFSVGY